MKYYWESMDPADGGIIEAPTDADAMLLAPEQADVIYQEMAPGHMRIIMDHKINKAR